MKLITTLAAVCLSASALAQVQLGKNVQVGSGGTGGGATTPATSLVLKGAGTVNGVAPATPGVDYVIPGGNVATATSLFANPTQCSGATPVATGIAANGNAICTTGGGGNVIASPQFRMSFFPTAGTVAAVQGDAGSTTDGSGNVIHKSVTTSDTNRVFSQTGSDTQNNTAPQFANGQGEPFGVHNFNLNFSGYGKSIGPAGGVSAGDQGWRVAVGPQIQGNIYGAGIHQLFATNARKWGIGDFGGIFMCPSGGGCFSGGAVTPADQGSQVILVSSTQFLNFYHGTVTATTGLGDTSPVISSGTSQFGGEAIIGGGYLINTSKTILSASLVGSTSTQFESTPLGLLQISGGASPTTGMCQLTTYVASSTVLGVPQSQPFSCTTHDGLPITAGNKAYIDSVGGEPYEQVTIQTVSGSGTLSGTILSATPHPIGAMIFMGGTQGSLSMDDDLSVLGNLTDFPVLGATDSTHLIIATQDGQGGVGLPYSGIMYQSLTGGIHVFASAKITFVGTDGLTNHVEINKVNWQVGDNVASPTPSSYLENGVAIVSTAHTQQNSRNPSLGFGLSTQGPVTFAYKPFAWANNFDTSKYFGNGGRLVAPNFLDQTGAQSNFATFDDPLGGGNCSRATVLCDLNPGNHTHDLGIYEDHGTGHSLVLKRSQSLWDFGIDNIIATNIFLKPTGGGNSTINFQGFFGAPTIQYLDLGAGRRIGTGITGGGVIQNWCIVGGGELFQWVNGGDINAGSALMTLRCDDGQFILGGGVRFGTQGNFAATGGSGAGQTRIEQNIVTNPNGVQDFIDPTQPASRLTLSQDGSVTIQTTPPSTGGTPIFSTGGSLSVGSVSAGSFHATGGIPSISTGTASNTDVAGQLTLSGGTATYTFTGTYTSAPICTASDTTAVNAVSVSATTTVLTLTGTTTDVINYICIGRN